jgi:uncharacterized membrane protein
VSPPPSIPLSSVSRLAGAARWTLAARIGLAVCLVGGLVGAFLLTRHDTQSDAFLQRGRSPVVALDVSWSVSYSRSKLIEQTLRDLVGSGRRLGLVLFSDTAYQALPIGTRADAVRPFLRFFHGRGDNPWQATFSAGTRISVALDLARQMFRQAQVANGSVVLISDLDDSPNDETDLARTLVTYQRDHIPIRMIAVNAVREDEQFFREALGSDGSVTSLRTRAGVDDGSGFPISLVAVVLLVALLLALNEQILGALTWGRGRRAA